MTQIVVKNIRLPLESPEVMALTEAKKRLRPLLPAGDIRSASVYRKSVDARRWDRLTFVYSVLVETEAAVAEDKLKGMDCAVLDDASLPEETGEETLAGRVIIAGFGPAGMFAGLLLAERGYRPLILERGGDVCDRVRKVERFYQTGELDTETNIQFGAGGAGTFSDGKLVTRINDSRCRYVLERFREFGAPEEILTEAKPHIGTDRLRTVVGAIRDRIRALGGEIRFDTKLTGMKRDGAGRVTAVVTAAGEIPCGALLLAVGHSARDTYGELKKAGFTLVNKPFSVGVRIEHLQKDIDRALYGRYADSPYLRHAEYALSKRVGNDAVYTFCMCPGGEVVAAASEDGGVVTNGMSRFARDGVNANAAVAVSVESENPVEFQRMLESAAYQAGGGGFAAPVETVGDFLAGKATHEPKRVLPSYMGGGGNWRVAELSGLLPPGITSMLKLGLADFEHKLRGFSAPDAVLTGFETRTSSPVRMTRNDGVLTACGADNLYPAGEGAGYAGGITSAAVDGLACALALMKRFGRPE